jgi:glutamate N-acetyltransferase/amino-acid N-acetyltransferase
MSSEWKLPRGYRFAGMHCGIRAEPGRLDLGVVLSSRTASAAGAFTQNRVRAAPVRVTQERLPRGDARGVVVCSGNANACTGQRGLDDARRMCAVGAEASGCEEQQFLVCSTGVIGRHLPMQAVEPGVRQAVASAEASAEGLRRFAQAILTTDTVTKVASHELVLPEGRVVLTGVAKGAAMIGPNMATMLAFVFSDALVEPGDLATITRRSAAHTFNCVRVEGHTSTNDTLLMLANGAAAASPLRGPSLAAFAGAAESLCGELARMIAADAEGAQHLVTIDVEGLRDASEAYKVACAVADSPLCKTAIFGADPNWGRFVSAAGYAGVPFEEEQLSLWLGDMLLYEQGAPVPFDAAAASAYLRHNRNVHLRLKFALGSGRATVWTCDLTHEYVKLNAEYTT